MRDEAPLRSITESLTALGHLHVTGPPVQTYSIATAMRRIMILFLDSAALRLGSGCAAALRAPFGCHSGRVSAPVFLDSAAFRLSEGTGVDNGVNMLYRWREARNKSELILTRAVGKSGGLKMLSRMFGTAAIVLALALLASVAYAGGESRARSDEVVKEAEATIMEAGNKSPLDTKMVNHAIDQLHQALKIDPRNDSAYVDLGFCYGLLREASTAEDMYRTATLINPSPGNFKELADVYLRAGDPEAALMAANAGLQKDPRNAKLYNAKGLALNDLQRSDEAEQAFRQAVRYDPSLEVARQNLEAISGSAGKSGKRSQ
jgi:Tfp pilus assembly protein PilF